MASRKFAAIKIANFMAEPPPLHNWVIGLADRMAVAPDEGCSAKFATKCEANSVFIRI